MEREFAKEILKQGVFASEQVTEGKHFPLTAGQEGVYYACVADPKNLMYNTPMICNLPEGTDVQRLKTAIERVLRNYAAFSVRFAIIDGQVRMIPRETYVDISIREAESLQTAKTAFIRPFNLEKGQLSHFEILHAEGRLWMLMDIHHIIFDGTSLGLILNAIGKAYAGQPLPKEEISLFGAGSMEDALSKTEVYARSRAFFEEKLADNEFDGCLLSDDIGERITARAEASTVNISFDDVISAEVLEAFAKEHGLTEASIWLGDFAYAMSKALGAEGCRFCTANSGRYDAALRNTVGMLVRTMPMSVRINEERSAVEYLQELQRLFHETIVNDSYPFSKLAQEFDITNDTMFVYQGESFNSFSFAGEQIPIQLIDIPHALSKFILHIFKENGSYRACAYYQNDLYHEETVQMLLKLMKQAIGGFVGNFKLKDIPLADTEILRILDSFHGKSRNEPAESLVDMLRAQFCATPNNIAIVSGDTRLTYRQLDEITDRLAAHLVKRGIGKEDVIAVLSDRNEMMAICPIAVIKAGAMYQPLDSTYPSDRLTFMVKDSGAKLLISPAELRHLVETDVETFYSEEIATLPECDISLPKPAPGDAFVILYTSGSTGLPKGCILEHGNLVAFIRDYIERYGLNEYSRTIAYASFGFDANMMDMYTPLCVGAQLYIIPVDMRLDFAALNTYMEDNGITHAFFTTQVGRQFATTMKNKNLKYILTGGEALTPCEPPKDYTLVNIYGPTECAVAVTGFEVDKLHASVPIGRANQEVGLYIVDKYMRRVPVGVPGELCISGPQVSRGYLNRPEKTAEVFLGNPFTQDTVHKRMYRTGDIVRFLPDGNIQFIGRRDSQVKIRGFRIELSEVERVIREFEAIDDATVVAKDAPGGGKMLWAYVVSEQQVDIDELNRFILERKPSYMVPTATMQIDKIPLTQNMKVDRRKLPEIKMNRIRQEKRAMTQLEKDIIQVVSQMTGNDDVPVSLPLSMVGISSISAISLASNLEERFGVPIDVKLLLSDGSVLDVENEIIRLLMDGNQMAPIQENKQDKYPLTQTQLGIYLECLKTGHNSDVYNIPMLWRFDAELDAKKLCSAVKTALCAHPGLLCTIRQETDGNVYMLPGDESNCQVSIHTISEETLMETVTSLRKIFDLAQGPLFAANILQTEQCCYLLLEVHHVIADGTSLGLLLDDIGKIYEGAVPEKERISQFDLAIWEAKDRKTPALEKAKAYYAALISDVQSSPVPQGDCMVQESQKAAVFSKPMTLSAKAIEDYVKQRNLTENAFFTTAFAMVLCKYTGRNDALFTTIYHGRTDLRTARTVGMLVKTLPVMAKFEAKSSVFECVGEMKEQLMHSMSYDLYSFAEISREFELDAEVMFVYQGDILQTQTVGGKEVTAITLELEGLKNSFSVEVHRKDEGFLFQMEYDACRYSEDYVALFADALNKAAEQMLCCQCYGEISVLSPSSAELLRHFNDTKISVPSIPAYRLMEKSAELYPERTACIACGEALTYDQLNQAANRVAHRLIAEGVRLGTFVGLLLSRTNNVYITRQGILKSGGAFISLDPEYPDDRIAFILENSNCKLILTTKKLYEERKALLQSAGVSVLFVEEVCREGRTDNPSLSIPDDTPAYCIYTSGSTGTPKGVLVSQKNLVNFAVVNDKNLEAKFYIEGNQVFLALASICFDVSIMEEFWPFAEGKTVCMATEEEIHDVSKLFMLLQKNNVDAICCTPSFLANILSMPGAKEALAPVNAYDIGAEAYLPALTAAIHSINPQARIINGYGPTETTISCTSTIITEGERITIGTPNANVGAYILDSFNNVLPPCAVGELAITGNGVGLGYWKLPERTEKAFVAIQTPEGSEHAYKSGDSAMLLPDGRIVFFGRMDDQVKLRGLRIELGEIQSVLLSYEGIRNCIVLVIGEGMSAYLAAWYTADTEIDKTALLNYMATKLAAYMLPTALMQLEELPMTANKKVDKKRLPMPEQQTTNSAGEAPKTEAEADYCRIMAETLGMEKYGATDDFFEMGGSSLLASQVLMKANILGYSITYSDVFSHPNPRALATIDGEEVSESGDVRPNTDMQISDYDYTDIHSLLCENNIQAVNDGEYRELGNICITGAAGFLGVHILKEFLDTREGTAYCVLRGNRRMSAENRLRTLLAYYFSDEMDCFFGNRIIVVDGDITKRSLYDKLMDCPIDTYINSAANVKHFSAGTDIEDINVGGVELGTEFALRKGCRFIQISTVSIAGMSVDNTPDASTLLREDMLYFGQDLSNKYIHSKFLAERIVLEKSLQGLDGKVIRVGNLMARYTDGEFQANFLSNNFLKTLKAYSIIGAIPYDQMDADCEFAPIDCTASAVLTLARLPGECRVFHAYNNHTVHMSDIIAQLRVCGVHIKPVEQEEYEKAYIKALENSENFASLNALSAYQEHSKQVAVIGSDNTFTSQVLYRQNYQWPLISPDYLQNFLTVMTQLGYFD